MKYVGLLINRLGKQTKNERDQVTDTSGISDDEILGYLNDAQIKFQEAIFRTSGHTSFFETNDVQTIVSGTREYQVPDDAFFFKVKQVSARRNSGEDYYDLIYVPTPRFTSEEEGATPCYYTLAGFGKISIDPIPNTSGGSLRIRYPRSLKALDKRRGLIESVSGTYDSIVLTDDTILDSDAIENFVGDYLCACNAQGTVAYTNALISAYDSSTRTITLSGATTADGTLSAGQYITLGRYTTTHSELPKELEPFLIQYADWKMKKKDSSEDAIESNQELVDMVDEAIAQFATQSLDLQTVMYAEPEWLDD